MIITSDTLDLERLRSALSSTGSEVLIDEPMSRHTTFRIGGPADLFCIVNTADQLIAAVKVCRENEVPIFILGGGSNILVSDAGIRGVTIKNETRSISIRDEFVSVASGYLMPTLARTAANHGLSGCEFAQAIPGTVGGGVRQNARFRHPGNFDLYEGFLATRDLYIGELVESVSVMTQDNSILDLSNSDCKFVYEGFFRSGFGDTSDIILSALLRLRYDSPQNVLQRLRIYSNYRMSRSIQSDGQEIIQPLDPYTGTRPSQPSGATAGCTFFNIPNHGDHPTGRMIDMCGLKGLQVGDAQISPDHANYIVNRGKAKASDVRSLMEICKKEVGREFGVELIEEIQLVGDWQ